MKSEVRLSYSRRAVNLASEVTKSGSSPPKEGDKDTMNEDAIPDLDRLQKMTVRELRELAGSLGLPKRGSKKDLVSSLMACSSSFDDNGTDNAQSTTGGRSPEKRPSKRKDRGGVSLVDESINTKVLISETTSRRKTSRVRQQSSTRIAKEDGDLVSSEVSHKSLVETQETLDKHDTSGKQLEPWTLLAHKKPEAGWIAYNPRTMRPPPLDRQTKHLKILSWNVNGLRALLKLEGFSAVKLAQREDFDVLCLQETKMQERDVDVIKASLLDGYSDTFWSCSATKLGYSGTAVISRVKPVSVKYGLGVADHDNEGRLVTVEFEGFYLLTAYVPNSGDGLKRLTYRVKEWDPSLSNYMKELEKSKPVILTGDLNCAHHEIDIYDPAGNRRSAGFTIEERESFETNFLSKGFVDTFRQQHPNVLAYTYWGYRHGGRKVNKGWRLDYFLASQSIADKVHDSYILPDVAGSDHCPVGLVLKL